MELPSRTASPTPAAPPHTVTASASPRTSRARSRSVAPSARLTPKSRIRSKTAAAIVLASDRPPITSASAPIPTSSAAKNAVEARSSRDSSLGSCTLTSGTSAMIRRATASGSAPSRQPTATPVLRSPAVSAAAPDATTVPSRRPFPTHCPRATARREARAHSHPPPGHGDLAEDEAVAALDEAHDALAHGAQRDETGDADRDPGDRERVPAKNSQHAAARTLRFTDSPRLRLRLVRSGSQTRLACGCGSYAPVHRLASPAAAARTPPFTDSP